MPKVTIIMLSWNSQDFISFSIESIINQTFKDWELLIYDDASNDGTLNIIKGYMKYDKRIKLSGINLEREGHNGIGRMRNICLKHSRGEFIAICDSDDIRYPRNIEMCIERFNNYPLYALLATDYDEIDHNNNILKPSTCLRNRKNLILGKLNDIVDITKIMQTSGGGKGCPIAPCSTMIRKYYIFKAGLYSESWKYHTDSNLYRRISSLENTRFGIIPIISAAYRIHENQRTKISHSQKWSEPLIL